MDLSAQFSLRLWPYDVVWLTSLTNNVIWVEFVRSWNIHSTEVKVWKVNFVGLLQASPPWLWPWLFRQGQTSKAKAKATKFGLEAKEGLTSLLVFWSRDCCDSMHELMSTSDCVGFFLLLRLGSASNLRLGADTVQRCARNTTNAADASILASAGVRCVLSLRQLRLLRLSRTFWRALRLMATTLYSANVQMRLKICLPLVLE